MVIDPWTRTLPPDGRSRISLTTPRERQYWMNTLGVTEARLRLAVAKMGVSVTAVRLYLNKLNQLDLVL
jgi:hypothetical protein